MLRRIKCLIRGGHKFRTNSITKYGCYNCYNSVPLKTHHKKVNSAYHKGLKEREIMTGQEFYNRFKKELRESKVAIHPSVDEAAKKAANL